MDDGEFAEINSTSIKIFNKNKTTIRKQQSIKDQQKSSIANGSQTFYAQRDL